MVYWYYYFIDKAARNAFVESVSGRADLQQRGVCVANVANEVVLDDGRTGFLAVLSDMERNSATELYLKCSSCQYVCENGSPCDY